MASGSGVNRVGLVEGPEAVQPGQDARLALIDPGLDIGREDVAPAERPDPEGNRHGVLRLVADRNGDAAHPELLGPGSSAVMEPDGGRAGGQAFDLDLLPADPPDAQAKDLADGLLGSPPAGHRLRAAADIAALSGGQDPVAEALAEL